MIIPCILSNVSVLYVGIYNCSLSTPSICFSHLEGKHHLFVQEFLQGWPLLPALMCLEGTQSCNSWCLYGVTQMCDTDQSLNLWLTTMLVLMVLLHLTCSKCMKNYTFPFTWIVSHWCLFWGCFVLGFFWMQQVLLRCICFAIKAVWTQRFAFKCILLSSSMLKCRRQLSG